MVPHLACRGDFLPPPAPRAAGILAAQHGATLAARVRRGLAEEDCSMAMTERRVYRSHPVRRVLTSLAVAVLAVLAVALAYELVGLPRVAAVSPARDGHVGDAAPAIVLDVHGAGGLSGVRVTLDGQDVGERATWRGDRLTVAGVSLADGAHTVRITADSSNLLRRRLDARVGFTVDTEAPGLKLDPSCADGTLTTSPPEISGTTEPGAEVRLGGVTVPMLTSADAAGRFVLHPALDPGPASVDVTVADLAGNATSRQLDLWYDATTPTLTVDPLPKTLDTAGRTVSVSAADAEQPPMLTATLDGRPRRVTGAAGAARVRLAAMAQGRHTLVVTATDRGGNRTTSRQAFVVDSSERLGAAAMWPGAVGRDVRDLQHLLAARGFLDGSAGGSYDARTETAVEAFQRQYGLSVDGRVDGATLTALSGRIVVDLSDLTLRFYRAGKLNATYRVAAGQSAYPTPTGTYAVARLIEDPTWYPPNSDWAKDAEPIPPGVTNPLGTRWIGTTAPGVGIHGTPDDGSIGTYASHGCIRMHIPDVEALYEKVALGMTVVIQS
jgi:lipoprotein-anchoring transpeptidase ErfK/SrfK